MMFLCEQALATGTKQLARLDLSGNDVTADAMNAVAKAIVK